MKTNLKVFVSDSTIRTGVYKPYTDLAVIEAKGMRYVISTEGDEEVYLYKTNIRTGQKEQECISNIAAQWKSIADITLYLCKMY